jgi:hypothetical protein
VQERGAPQGRVQPRAFEVEHVVVEPATERREQADRQLDDREGRERGRPRQAAAQQAAGVAAQAQARHEGRDDQRDRVDADAGLQGQDALPGHLVDERRGAGQAEERGHHRQQPGRRRALCRGNARLR